MKRHNGVKMSNYTAIKYWAALVGKGPETRIVRVSGCAAFARFDSQIFKFSCEGYMRWVAGGARYCELFISTISDIPQVGAGGLASDDVYLRDYQHGPVRKSKGAHQIFE